MKFIVNNNEHVQDYSIAPGQLLRSVHIEKSYLFKAGYQRVTHFLKLPWGNEKLM